MSPKERNLKMAFDMCRHHGIGGDYLEFGVFRGNSFAAAYHFAKQLHLDDMTFYAFDSFEGLPHIADVDKGTTKEFFEGAYACSEDDFKYNLRKERVPLKKVTVISGWFKDTLNQKTKQSLPLKKAAVVMIDCDLYESTVPVLDFLTDYLQEGTVIIFDDWNCFKSSSNKGQRRAFKEWRKKSQHIQLSVLNQYWWQGISFIVTSIT